MHFIRRPFAIRSLVWSSICFVLAFASLPVVIAAVLYMVASRSEDSMKLSGAVAGISLLLWIITLISSRRSRCQLCQAPIFGSLKCSLNPRAKRALGSYRLRVCFSILFQRNFRCPYCGQSFTLSKSKKSLSLPAVPNRRVISTKHGKGIPDRKRKL